MDALRRVLATLRNNWRAASHAQRRGWLAALGGAITVFALTGTLVAFGGAHPSGPRALVSTATATASDTSTSTSTATPQPTATKPVATAVPKVLSHAPPPPPAQPTPPPATPTAIACTPTPTATTAATATNTAATSATTSATTATSNVIAATSCTSTCPTYLGNNPSNSQIQSALSAAADQYQLPRNLVYSVAWQESKWHEDVTSCDGGVGLMQIQYYLADYFNTQISYGSCGLGTTSYDIHTLQGNANLGAKVLRYLYCYYTYGAGYGGLPSAPADGSSAYYYQQAGLQYPDVKKLDGSANPDGFCASVYNSPNFPQYPALPSTTADPWGCPYSATAGDATLLDLVLSAYNAGQGAISNCSCIPNPWYPASVEFFVPQFAGGALPQ